MRRMQGLYVTLAEMYAALIGGAVGILNELGASFTREDAIFWGTMLSLASAFLVPWVRLLFERLDRRKKKESA